MRHDSGRREFQTNGSCERLDTGTNNDTRVIKQTYVNKTLYFGAYPLIALLVQGTAEAQSYPTRPIRLLVPAAPGGGADIVSRFIAVRLSDSLGQNVVVDNRAGAGGQIGAETVAKAPPDGYTLLTGQSTSLAIAPALFPKLSYKTERDFAPITLAVTVPNVLLVNSGTKVQSVQELISSAKAGARLSFSSAGSGSPGHLATELFQSLSAITVTHVPYKGAGPAVLAVVSGEVQATFASLSSAMPQIKSGRLKPLAVTSSARSVATPTIPTLGESGLKGVDLVSWFGLLAPAATPSAITERLEKAIVAVLREPELKARLQEDGSTVVANSSAEFASFIRSELRLYRKLVADAAIVAQ